MGAVSNSTVPPGLGTLQVLGVPLLAADYAALAAQCPAWTRQPGCVALDFANTQIATLFWHYKSQLRRGVVLAVGFGVITGLKPDQPLWMQRLGLGWLFRLCSEPGRLLGRYLKYNSLFLFYLLADGLRGRAWGKDQLATRPSR